MYWVIFAWPDWPSLRSCSSRGITTVSSCRMIDDVMYGIMPSAKTESESSAPPENRFSRDRTPPPPPSYWIALMQFWMLVYDTPGLGKVAPSR